VVLLEEVALWHELLNVQMQKFTIVAFLANASQPKVANHALVAFDMAIRTEWTTCAAAVGAFKALVF
jgi:hypothetical protein